MRGLLSALVSQVQPKSRSVCVCTVTAVALLWKRAFDPQGPEVSPGLEACSILRSSIHYYPPMWVYELARSPAGLIVPQLHHGGGREAHGIPNGGAAREVPGPKSP